MEMQIQNLTPDSSCKAELRVFYVTWNARIEGLLKFSGWGWGGGRAHLRGSKTLIRGVAFKNGLNSVSLKFLACEMGPLMAFEKCARVLILIDTMQLFNTETDEKCRDYCFTVHGAMPWAEDYGIVRIVKQGIIQTSLIVWGVQKHPQLYHSGETDRVASNTNVRGGHVVPALKSWSGWC